MRFSFHLLKNCIAFSLPFKESLTVKAPAFRPAQFSFIRTECAVLCLLFSDWTQNITLLGILHNSAKARLE